MKQPIDSERVGLASLRIIAVLVLLLVPLMLLAQAPQWWADRGVTNGNPTNDYAAVNQGQIKNIATKAVAEIDAGLPGGAGDLLHTLATNLSGTTANTNDYAAANIGQLKNLSKPFFDRLLQVGYRGHPLESGTYPWTGKENSSNDYAMVNIGQVKNIFSFDLTLTGTSGIPDWWQNYYFGGAVADPNAIAPSGILINGSPVTILQAYQNGLNPIDFYNGSAPTLTITNGNNQTGSPGTFLFTQLVVKVTDNSGMPMTQAPVTFTVTQGGGTLQTTNDGTNSNMLTVRTNSGGYAKTYFKLPNTPITTCQIACMPATGNYTQSVVFTENSDNGSGSYSTPTLPSSGQPEDPPMPPVVSYPAIDVSGTNGINICTLDDTNKMAFAFLSDNDTATVMTWTSGSTQTVQQVHLSNSFTVEIDDDPADNVHVDVTYIPEYVTTSGKLYGSAQGNVYDNNYNGVWKSWGFSSSGGQIADIGNARWESIDTLWAPTSYRITAATENAWGGDTNVYCRNAATGVWRCLGDYGIGFVSVNGYETYFNLLGQVSASGSDGRFQLVLAPDGAMSVAVTAVNDGGWCLGTWGDWFVGQGGGPGSYGFLWNGSQVIIMGSNECLLALNNNNQVIGWDTSSNEGFIWQGGNRTVLTTLIPTDYQGEISGIFPRLISNSGTNGIIHILLDATFTDPTDGSHSNKTYVLSGPYATLSSTNCTLQEVQLPDGMNSSDIRCINANGWLAFIHNESSGSSMTTNARMANTAAQSMAAAESTAPAVPSVSAGPPIKVVELSPKVKDESGNEISGSEKPSSGTLLTPFVEVEPATNRIAHREIKVQVSDTLKGKKVTWSLEVLPGATPATIRGKWSDSTTHKDRFEASTAYGENGFHKVSQEQGETTIANDGSTAIRVNVPPIGLNQVRIKIQIEGASAPVNLIDMEVPAVVVIDPGHGGADSGTVGRTDSSVFEKDLTLEYALALKQKIVEKFVTEKHRLLLVMTRTNSGEYMENGLRANLARDKGADVFQSIHFNSSDPNANGNYPRGTLYCTRSTGQVNATEDDALGGAVQGATLGAVQASDSQGKSLGSVAGVFAVLSDSNYGNSTDYHPIRGSLIEVEFLSNEAALTTVKLSGQTGAAIKTKFAADVSDVIFNNIKNQQ